jgi:RNA polymerase sigma-70 factor, ECF subfamily
MSEATTTFAIATKGEDMNQEVSMTVQTCDPTVWVDKHGDCLFRYALSYVRHVETAEDLVQETFLAALSSQNRFSGGSSERTWLVGILKHKVIDHYRAAKKQNTIAELADVCNDEMPWSGNRHDERACMDLPVKEWHINPGICSQQKAFWEVLQLCLSKVSPRLASAFALKEIEQLDTKEICESLNISEGNLWVILHRARTYLKQCLEINWLNKAA